MIRSSALPTVLLVALAAAALCCCGADARRVPGSAAAAARLHARRALQGSANAYASASSSSGATAVATATSSSSSSPQQPSSGQGPESPSSPPKQQQQGGSASSAPVNQQGDAQPTASTSNHAQQPTDTQNVQPSSSSYAPGGDMSAVLSLHNTLRRKHGAAPLSWSDALAGPAQAWAEGCVMQHSSGGGASYGENLAMGYVSPADGVQVWYDEMSGYDYASGGFSEATGHATQMLWKASTEMGCGWAAGCKLLVCRYTPPGNVEGEYQANVAPPSGA